MGIRVSNPKTKMPKALKLASSIISYLFEEEYGECEYMSVSQKETLNKASRMLQKVAHKNTK